MKKIKDKKCCICGKPLTGFGNNAEPVRAGICCDDCNANIVIPARFIGLINYKKSNQVNDVA